MTADLFRAQCNYCGVSEMIEPDNNDWEFMGYDDDRTKLWLCPDCSEIAYIEDHNQCPCGCENGKTKCVYEGAYKHLEHKDG